MVDIEDETYLNKKDSIKTGSAHLGKLSKLFWTFTYFVVPKEPGRERNTSKTHDFPSTISQH